MQSKDEFSRESAARGADAKAQASGTLAEAVEKPLTIDAADWFGGRREVRLLHRGQEYRLRVTKQGKLILTK